MKKILPHFLPFAFCVFLSGIWFVVSSFFQSDRSAGTAPWQPAFFCFLPMCFFFVASNTMRMEKELEELREKVALLELAALAKQIQKP